MEEKKGPFYLILTNTAKCCRRENSLYFLHVSTGPKKTNLYQWIYVSITTGGGKYFFYYYFLEKRTALHLSNVHFTIH